MLLISVAVYDIMGGGRASILRPETDVLTVPEAARYLRIHEQTVYQLLRSGRLAGRKVGRAWRIHVETLEAYVKSSEAGEGRSSASSR